MAGEGRLANQTTLLKAVSGDDVKVAFINHTTAAAVDTVAVPGIFNVLGVIASRVSDSINTQRRFLMVPLVRFR